MPCSPVAGGRGYSELRDSDTACVCVCVCVPVFMCVYVCDACVECVLS